MEGLQNNFTFAPRPSTDVLAAVAVAVVAAAAVVVVAAAFRRFVS